MDVDLNLIINGIEQYGYAALFFFLWLGIVGLPIPDEMIVMCGGFVTSLGILKPLPSFLLTYAGVVTGLSIGYCIGRAIGSPALLYLMRKKKMGKYIEKAHKLTNQYGVFSLIISYFFPVVRHVVPYIVGMNKMSFANYALFSYSTGFVWTLLLFLVGRYFGTYLRLYGEYLMEYSWASVIVFSLITLLWVILSRLGKSKENTV